jgi:YidC/Oxa1 family membrane protein insertase
MLEQQNNRITTYIGMGLIFVLMLLWMKYATPTPGEQTQTVPQTEQTPTNAPQQVVAPAITPSPNDTIFSQQLASKFGAFSASATGTDQIETLENELVKIEFTNKGGRIKSVTVKNYSKLNSDSAGNDVKSQLYLLEDLKNRFDYSMSVSGAEGG